MSAHPIARRPPPWRDVRVLRVAIQAAFVVGVLLVLSFLWSNLTENLRRLGIELDFSFLDQRAGFAIADSDFRSFQPIRDALVVGVKNTAKVAFTGIVLATVLGVIVGIARLSPNWLIRRAAAAYVESLRNVPVLTIILFWYLAVFLQLPPISRAQEWLGVIVLSNRGLALPKVVSTGGLTVFLAFAVVGLAAAVAAWVWRTRVFERTGARSRRVTWAGGVLLAALVVGFLAGGRPLTIDLPERGDLSSVGGFRLSPEYGALLVALVLYTASHIAEIVRGSILAVPLGQGEAAQALGLSPFRRMRHVILPQAFRVSVPPIANQYLNLTKNTSLGVAVAYPEVMQVTKVTISQGSPAPQAIAVVMVIYLLFSLGIALVANLVNRRLGRWSR